MWNCIHTYIYVHIFISSPVSCNKWIFIKDLHMTSGCPFSFLLGKWPTADLHVYYTIEDTNHSKIVFIIFFHLLFNINLNANYVGFFFHYSFNCINQTYCNKTFCILIFSWIVDFRFSSPRRSRRWCSDLVFEAGHVSN